MNGGGYLRRDDAVALRVYNAAICSDGEEAQGRAATGPARLHRLLMRF